MTSGGALSSDEQPPVASAVAKARDAIAAKKVLIGADPSKGRPMFDMHLTRTTPRAPNAPRVERREVANAMTTPHGRIAAVALGALVLGGFAVASARGERRDLAMPAAPARVAGPTSAVVAPPSAEPTPDAIQLDGRALPDGVLALTWDDGPDSKTLALAEYLAQNHVAGTFFVVNEWVANLSSDPGQGRGVFETGYQSIPILGELVKLRHRLGNHTLNHVLLAGAEPKMVDLEVRANQEQIDPFLTNDLRMFRVPGGAWSADAAKVVAADPSLRGMVGPHSLGRRSQGLV